MRKKIQIVIDMDISYQYINDNQSLLNQLDIGLSNIVSTDKSIIPALYTMKDDRVLDTLVPVKHQGSGAITIQVKRDNIVVSKQRFDELADDF